MSQSETAELQAFGTADAQTDNPRDECWCAEKNLACFDHYQAEKQLRGEF